MATITQETHIELSGHEALALGRLRGVVVACARGELWLTVDGEGRDVILGPGDACAVDSDAEVVVSAFGPAALELRMPSVH